MDSVSMNHYEKQLYTVFKTFDVDNEEALDKSAVQALCDALQLEEKGAALVGTLFKERSDRVTFDQFRNGLLTVLGDSSDSAPGYATSGATETPNVQQFSDDDSSGREVAPKFVFGSKKYGRRSRPRRTSDGRDESHSPRSSSVSRLETDEKKAGRKMRCKRSASVMDAREDGWSPDIEQKNSTIIPSDFDHNRRVDRQQALALCRSLHMDGIDVNLIEHVFADSSSVETTVGEFFERLNVSLSSTIDEVSSVNIVTNHHDKNIIRDDDNTVATEVVLEALDSAGIPQSRRLLLELGFTTDTVRPPDIEQALEDELRALAEPIDEQRNARSLLLMAALALGRLRLELARQKAAVIIGERDKLKGDLLEANKRAGLLAQEVDESHARIENELKGKIKKMEARHVESIRLVAAENAVEREQAALQRATLEAEIARHSESENRLRTEVTSLKTRIEEAETRANAADERALLAELERSQLIAELQVERERGGKEVEHGRGAMGELVARVDELQIENKLLRDRNDELCAEMEALARRAAFGTDTESNENSNLKFMSREEGDLSTELNSLLGRDRSEDCDSSPVSMDQKLLGHIGAIARLREIFNNIHAVPSPDGGHYITNFESIQECVRELSDSLLVAPSLNSYLSKDVDVQTDNSIPASGKDVDHLRQELFDVERKHDEEKQKLAGIIRDLESSLEQMKSEYDKSEDYWSGKLDEERAMFNEEQRLGDERLAELIGKISEYERQFAASASANALPTIDEKYSLEAQVNDLDEEFTRYRKEKEAELGERDAEIARLRTQLEEVERD